MTRRLPDARARAEMRRMATSHDYSTDPRREVVADVLAGTRFPAKLFHDEGVRMVVEIEAEMILEALDKGLVRHA